MKVKFVCPSCKHTILRQVSIDIIKNINEDNMCKSTAMTIEVDVFHYACARCGFVIHVASENELFYWLEKNNMLEFA